MVQTDRLTTKKIRRRGDSPYITKRRSHEVYSQVAVPVTNNEAEYDALLTGLKLAKVLEARDVIVQANFQLVIGQVRGDYKAKEERMQKYLTLV